MLFREAIKAFLKHMTTIGRSPATVKNYGAILARFAKDVEARHNGPVYVDDLTPTDVEAYLEELLDRGLKAGSRSAVVYAARSFLHWAYKKRLTERDVAVDIETIQTPRRERTYLSTAECEELAAAVDSPVIRALVRTLYLTGLRIREALNLTLDDVDMQRGVIHVRAGKGNRDRLVPIGDRLREVMVSYLESDRPAAADQRFFGTERSGALSATHVERVLMLTTKKLGWNKHVTPHVLRHSFATALVKSNVSIVRIQRLLGHSDVKITSIYTHASLDDLAEAVNAIQ